MLISHGRAKLRRPGRLFLAFLALLGLSSGLAGEALAQCQLVTGPTRLTCPDCNTNRNPPQVFNNSPGWVGLYRNSGGDRLMAPMTWGSIIYSLASPAFPSEIKVYDLRDASGGPGIPLRDGQSYGSGYGISSDGQRFLYSLHFIAETVVNVPIGDTFLPMGDTGVIDANAGLVVQINGGRYIAYGLGTAGSFFAVDITTLTRFSTASPIPFESPALFTSSTQGLALAEGNGKQFLYGYDSAGVRVVDVSTPGPVGSITSRFSAKSIPLSAFGLAGQTLLSASAAVDPATGKLYVLGSFWNGSRVPSFSLVLYDTTTSAPTLIGTFTSPPNSGYSSSAGLNVGTLAVNPNTDDVMAFMWFGGSFGLNRLYATSAKTFGSSIGQWADISGTAGGLSGTQILFKSRTDAYAYFMDGNSPWAMQLSCQAGATPATGRLSVSNTSTGGTSLLSGDTVFVGDTLSISPTVTPSNAVQAVTAWNLDLDYHASETGAIGLMQLAYPDACLLGCNNAFNLYPDPPAFPLVGPCDFQKSGVPATGTGCWGSVGPGPTGNGDFASAQPAAGTTATLPIAFEAQNALNTTTVPLATFNIVWKVPAVKVQNLSALLNGGSATFTDGSEGHPLSTGYKWYFGMDNTAPPSEPLTQDSLCTGPSCNHIFGLRKGTYNAWLMASYKNGYQSPNCINPCGGAAGSFKVSVTDFVASFAAPSSAIINTSLTITNNSQIGTGVTVNSYSYTLCDAGSSGCNDPGNYQPISGMGGPGTTGTVPAPGTGGTYWLRIRATYNTNSTAQWQPNVSGLSDTFAWPISVSSQPPYIAPTAGFSYCTVGSCPNSYTGTVGTPITVILTQGGTPVTGSFAWSVSGAGSSPATGSGSSFTFTPGSTGSAYVNVTNYTPAPSQVGFTISAATPPPSTLSVSVSASNNTPTTGTAISLQAYASGGTGTYPTYDWYITDGTSASSGFSSMGHTFTSTGSYTVTCTVHDSGGATANGSTTISVQAPAAPTNAIFPTAGYGYCTSGGCTATYTGQTGTPITVAAYQGATQLTGTYAWTVTGVSASPSSGTGSTFTFTPNGPGTATITNTTLSVSVIILIGGTAQPTYSIAPTAGFGYCTIGGCTVSYTGTTGTPITLTAFQGTTPLTGSYSWTVTGVNASPSSGTGSTFTFTPLGPGTATVTNTTLSASTGFLISGVAQVPDFTVSDAVRGNVTPGSDGSFLVVTGRSTTYTGVVKGTTTPLSGTVGWNFGDGGTSTSNPALKTYSTGGAWVVTLTFAGQIVQHAVFPVAGIPTGGYSFYPADGGLLDTNRVDPGRLLLFQATETFAQNYTWNFNDGTPTVSGWDKANVSHSFAAPGSYTVVLTETLGANAFTTALPTTFVVSYTPKWIVPGLAYASGILPGSFYVSDVVIQNPSKTQPMSLSLALADGTPPASMTWKSVQLSPMESRSYFNILQSFFGKAAGGPATALIVKGDVIPTNATPVIWASTYNNNGGDPTKGTFGVAIPAVPLSAAVSTASAGALTEFPGLRDVPDLSSRSSLVSYPNVPPAYTNVGFVNPGDVPATLKVNFYSSRLDTLFQPLGSEVTLTVNPNETRQITKALSAPAGAAWDIIGHPADNYFMTVSVGAGGKVVPYTTVKDIGSSDSVFMTNDGSIATSYRVPAVVRANGQFGAVFRSRLVLFNPSGQVRAVQLSLSFVKCTQPPLAVTCDPRQKVEGSLALWSGQTVIFEDFVKEWLIWNDFLLREDRDYTKSFVDVSPADLNTDPLLVRAETYNATPTGNFGTQVPGFVAAIHGASAAPGGPGKRLLIPRALPNGGAGGFRTNVALVLLSGTTGTAKVRLYPDTGVLPALPEVSLGLTAGEPFFQRSLEQLFPAITSFGTGNKYSLEIEVTDGTIGAYASINDNVTGDSTVLVARPQQ